MKKFNLANERNERKNTYRITPCRRREIATKLRSKSVSGSIVIVLRLNYDNWRCSSVRGEGARALRVHSRELSRERGIYAFLALEQTGYRGY